jgi:hypothetical protein
MRDSDGMEPAFAHQRGPEPRLVSHTKSVVSDLLYATDVPASIFFFMPLK